MATFNKSLCLLLVIFKITRSLGSYYISTSRRATYEDKQCRMAVPEIISWSEKGRARLDIKEVIGQMDKDETLWIGYFKFDMAFEYIGCVKESDIPGDQNPFTESINGILSKCYKNCQDSEVIGVTLEKCYCFDSSPGAWNKTLCHSSCDDVCVNPDSVACGGNHDNESYVSLYRTNKKVIKQNLSDKKDKKDNKNDKKDNKKDNGDTPKCLEYNPSPSGLDLKWKLCSEEKEVMCRYGKDVQRLSNKRLQWLDAAKSCFSNKSFPMSYSRALKLQQNGDSAWTGVFKLDIIYKKPYGETGENTNDTIWSGYMKRKRGEYFLHFTGDNLKKRVLCENKATDTTTSKDDQHIHTTQPTQDTNTGTAAIVSIIVVLVIIAIVIAVVLVHRRYKYSRRFDKMSETETVAGYEYNYPEFTNNSTNAEANTPVDVLYNYPDFTLQDASNTGGIRIGLNTYDDCNIDGTYNKTNTGKKGYSSTYANEDCECNDEQAERVYNQLENDDYNILSTRQKMVPDKTYDQAIQVQKSGTSASDDITYDSSMSSGVKLKKNVGGVTDNVYNTGNEIYNRIGEETEKRGGKSDNLYGTKQMEKCKYMKPASDTDSQTYNSTSEISETRGLTDNPYSKLDTEHKDK